MALQVQTAPSGEPITLDEAKAHLRVDHNEQDGLIGALIVAAREWFEDYTGRALITRTYDWTIDRFAPVLFVPMPPLQSVSSITYLDDAGSVQTLATSIYTVDTRSQPGRIVEAVDQFWPSTLGSVNDITIRFVAGYGTAGAVPETIRAALKLWVQGEYDQDDDARRAAAALADLHKVHYRIGNV